MKKIDIGKVLGIFAIVLISALIVAFLMITRGQGYDLVHNPADERIKPSQTPADYGMQYTDLVLTTSDNLNIHAWYIPGEHEAALILQHGYRQSREEMLGAAEIMSRYGYHIIMVDMRAHGYSDGEIIRFGVDEYRDLDAAYDYLLNLEAVNPDQIGILGNSLGAAISILYAAQNENIKAVAANSPFYSLEGTIATSIEYYTGLPAFPFAPAIRWWAERFTGINASDVSVVAYIDQLAPRPVYLMQGGRDVAVNPESGELLLSAAGEPSELWYEPNVGHTGFLDYDPEEYENRIASFFDTYLLTVEVVE